MSQYCVATQHVLYTTEEGSSQLSKHLVNITPLASEYCEIYHIVYLLPPPQLFAAALQGYLQRCRQHLALFPEERTDKLFANVERLLMFQKAFLEDIESQISQGASWNAQIGQCFLRHVSASYPHHHCS